MRNLRIYQYKVFNKTMCYIEFYSEHKVVCTLQSNEQVVLTKSQQSYKVRVNEITLYCDRVVIDGEVFTENQIILNFSENIEGIKSVNKKMTLG